MKYAIEILKIKLYRLKEKVDRLMDYAPEGYYGMGKDIKDCEDKIKELEKAIRILGEK